MNLLDEELKQDAIDDAREISYLREHLPEAIHSKLDDNDFQAILDEIVEYFALSDILEQNGDVQIDCQEIVGHIYGNLHSLHEKITQEDLLEVFLTDLDYNDI